MHHKVIRVTQTKGQTRITVPKKMAEETGINKAKMVLIENMVDKSIKIKGWVYDENRERDL